MEGSIPGKEQLKEGSVYTIQSHDAILVVATTRGKTYNMPPAIRGVVGKRSLVTASKLYI
jgi:hypothetical protein